MQHFGWLGTLALAMAAAPALSAEIKVVSAEAVRGALESVAAQYSKDSGHTLSFAFMTAGQVRGRIEGGEAADIAIASTTVIAALVQAGKASGPTDLGRIGMAVGIREGAPVPDVSTPEAFVRALRAARAISFTSPSAGGTAGIYTAGLLQRLGVADEMSRKIVHSTGGRDAATKVANGEADIALTFPSEILPIKGAKVAGMLPASLQNYTVYAAAIPAASNKPDIAQSYLAALTSPAAREHWIAKGFEPLGGK
jgi:molybdate transport system substrate-binding protein